MVHWYQDSQDHGEPGWKILSREDEGWRVQLHQYIDQPAASITLFSCLTGHSFLRDSCIWQNTMMISNVIWLRIMLKSFVYQEKTILTQITCIIYFITLLLHKQSCEDNKIDTIFIKINEQKYIHLELRYNVLNEAISSRNWESWCLQRGNDRE